VTGFTPGTSLILPGRWTVRHKALPDTCIIEPVNHAPLEAAHRVMKRLILFPFAGMLLLLVLFTLMLVANLHTFYRLSDESPIAELQFVNTGDGRYEAILSYGDFCNPERYTLYGDQWRLDARFLKWRPWANLLGFDSLYRIERLGGRYRDINRENMDPHEAHALHPPGTVDLVAVLARYRGRFSPVDTLYGSSVYEDMDVHAIFRVYRSQSGLLARKFALPSASHAAGVTTIEINRSCAESPGPFARAGRYLEKLLGRAGD
jgi:hypothetical protein